MNRGMHSSNINLLQTCVPKLELQGLAPWVSFWFWSHVFLVDHADTHLLPVHGNLLTHTKGNTQGTASCG